jgi:predicted patatin/cPLA2 family phospholipase
MIRFNILLNRKKGMAFVIQPVNPLKVGRVERNRRRLSELFTEGYEDGKHLYPSLIQWITE